jgi:hypothetical protein
MPWKEEEQGIESNKVQLTGGCLGQEEGGKKLSESRSCHKAETRHIAQFASLPDLLVPMRQG